MSNANSNSKNFKQRFKAVESFLRRVAFNLGNSPSQTEVKIISCIPVDVTDLQHKIFQLEQELEEAQNLCKKEYRGNKTVNRSDVCNTTCPTCRARCDESPYAGTGYSDGYTLDSCGVLSVCASSKQMKSLSPGIVSRPHSARISDKDTTSAEKVSKIKRAFSRHKKACKKKNCKTQFIYCAQTDTLTPFQNILSPSDDVTSKNISFKDSLRLSRSYLTDMVRKQYKTAPVLKGFSNSSDFSSPVCRDIPTNSQNTPFETDICSCCHLHFQNIDDHMNKRNQLHIYSTCENVADSERNAYYDSDYYDLVPVKEKSVKICNDTETQKRKEHKKPAIQCWPEKVRPKYRIVPMNYCSVPLPRDRCVKRFPAKSQNRKDIIMDQMAAKQRVKINAPHPQEDRVSSKLCSVDLGPAYRKQILKQKRVFLSSNQKRSVATSLTAVNNNANCQTTITAIENPAEDKTETTLNQIKQILQSVLTEVKTSTKIVKQPVPPKKDAVVQNGLSQSNELGGSELLQSYTYSLYNINPYIASCSQPPNNTYPDMQQRCVHQYPLLIQPQKHLCTSCYRNYNVPNTISARRAACVSTNTERAQERNNETELLIKEIYKSMAMNIELPSSNDNTVGEYTRHKSTTKDSSNVVQIENDRESKYITKAVSEIFRNTKPINSTATGNTGTNVISKLTSFETSVSSNQARQKHHLAERMRSYSRNTTNYTSATMDGETERMSHNLESEDQTEATITNEDTEQSSNETESDVTETNNAATTIEKKKEKNGIFNKIFKIFHPRQRRSSRRKVNAKKDVEDESNSDSDDYQTVYSHVVGPSKHKKVIKVRSRPHSKVFHSKQLQQRSRTRSPEKNPRKSPYMEQEYRRRWDEKLMFRGSRPRKYSTELSKDTTSTPTARKPIYNQYYDARNVLVDPIRCVPLRMPGNVLKQQHLPNSDYTRNGANNPNRSNYRGNMYNSRNNNFVGSSPIHTRKNNTYNTGHKPHVIAAKSSGQRKSKKAAKMAWLKKNKLGIQCGHQWKELILEG